MYDAVLVVSFGGPEGADQVMPFLENVVRGRPVPLQRLEEVAEHYYQFGGVSPLNAQVRALVAALVDQLNQHGPHLPVYWGCRNWHPMLAEALEQMATDGIRRALAFFPSPFSSYSSCRQYLEDIQRAREQVGPAAPAVEKLRAYFNHPGFIAAVADRTKAALNGLAPSRRRLAQLLFTAHSIPLAMAAGCAYQQQLQETARLVAEAVGHHRWQLVYQSRSGPASQPWLEPDICQVLEEIAKQGKTADVVVVPIGFISDHMEVAYDLDVEAREVCEQCGLHMVRASTVGTHPRFVSMIRQLILERVEQRGERPTLGTLGPAPDRCPPDCCVYQQPRRRGQPRTASTLNEPSQAADAHSNADPDA